MDYKVQGVVYRQQYRKCGKEGCRSCEEQGHGPYWYALEPGRAIRYIGKELPGHVLQYQARLKELAATIDAAKKARATQRDDADRFARECRDVIRNIEAALMGEHFDNELLERDGINIFLV